MSPRSPAKQAIEARDRRCRFPVDKLRYVSGIAQGLLEFLRKTKKVCLVAFDFVGLTTNPEDLKPFLRYAPTM
ncbi:uncharacterized protein BYT42DRAFT_623014 [Radiomyces spectabilis]|uniref:uncharacterized protein n=1 Tax=Radiomyces spectabilis TaxID=64574 RepID=UPI00221FB4CB|nr:uncharacterized protein BYT42DRAFT_623014 [Radiomyces spectabilis]KAI8371785.1 hypothetical protein BYT42DRAFT_623014 [Radiomyces spectabilis]